METKQIGETIYGPIEVTTRYACTFCGGERQPTVSSAIEDCGVSICLKCLLRFVTELQKFSWEMFRLSLYQVYTKRKEK